MQVTVVLLGVHRVYLPPGAAEGGRVTLELPSGRATPADVAAALGMPRDAGRMVVLAGEVIGEDHVLGDGDTVTFLWPIGGG